MRSAAAPLLICAALTLGCTSAAPLSRSSEAIIGGSVDPGDPGVVLVVILSGAGAVCTGEVLSPHVVLTAGHCVAGTAIRPNAHWRIFTGEHFTGQLTGSEIVNVTEAHAAPDYVAGLETLGADIAVLITETPLAQAPLVMNRQALTPGQQGQTVRLIGYGVTVGSDTMGQTAGTRHTTSAALSSVTATLIGFNDPNHSTCEGDSGGPALMKLDGTSEVIVGVTSFGTNMSCVPPGYDTRVDLYADSFVQPYIDKFDPVPPDMALGPDGYPPRAIGSTCGADQDCNPGLVCANPGAAGFCTAGCDPAAMPSLCPARTHCADYGGVTLCVRDGSGGGCAVTPWPSPGAGLLFALALALLCARRAYRRLRS